MTTKPKIVIVGAGFGGLYTYLNLHRVFHGMKNRPEITIVSKNNYFLFTPLLHEVATGSVNQSNIVQPIRQIFDRCLYRFLVATAYSVDIGKKVVKTSEGEVTYDYLVLALGADTNFHNFPKNLVFTLKNLTDAQALKNQIISVFEKANEIQDEQERRQLLTFVVIGGGTTGVELAAEITEFAGKTLLNTFPYIRPEEVRVYLVHAHSELIPDFDPSLRKKSLDLLQKQKNIQAKLNTRVQEVSGEGVRLSDGLFVPTKTPILTAGIKANSIEFSPIFPLNNRGQLKVSRYLQLDGAQNIFALGDMATVAYNPNIPQTAQVAEAEAKTVAYNILALLNNKPLKEFEYKERGQLVSLGRWNAVAEIKGLKFSGAAAWWVWRTIYAGKLVGWANRLRVILDWTVDIFYPRDISKLK